MDLCNRTPFAALTFSSVDSDGDPFQVVTLKGSFVIEKDAPLRRADVQVPIRLREVFWEDDRARSLRYEDDLAPRKTATDIIVNATSYAPCGRATSEWHASIAVAEREKRVLVTGPRAWVHTPLLGWSLSPAVPVASLPLRYELAFGGDGYEKNPVGLGFVDPRRVDRSREIRAPQILSPDGRLPVLGEPYPVEGFSAIAKAWQPRRVRAGTFAATDPPRLPEDFDYAFYNAAHPDLIQDGFLRGNEQVRMENMHPEHAALSFQLPGLVLLVVLTNRAGYRQGCRAVLDTVFIDADAMRAELTWRAPLAVRDHNSVARIDIAAGGMQ